MKKTVITLVIMLVAAAAALAGQREKIGIDMSLDTDGDGKVEDTEAALAIKNIYGLDRNNAISREMVLDSLHATKEQLYDIVMDWFARSFDEDGAAIQHSDKESGLFIAKTLIPDVAHASSFSSNTDISITVLVRIDMKDGKMKISTSVQKYEMLNDLNWLGIILNLDSPPARSYVEVVPSECYPFTKKIKKEGARALVASHIYSIGLIDSIRDAVISGTAAANENW